MGLKFRRWRKAGATWRDDHTKMTAGDVECVRSIGGEDAEKRKATVKTLRNIHCGSLK